MIIPIPTMREYGEYLESLDRPFDIDALLAGESLSNLDSHEVLIARFDDGTRDLDVLEPDDFDQIVDLETRAAGRPGRRRWLIAVAAAVATLLIIGSVLVRRTGDDTKTEMPADTTDAQAVAVATRFVDAVATFDADRAISYLADDADVSPMLLSVGATDAEGAPEELRFVMSLFRAQGYEQVEDPASRELRCVGTGSSESGSKVRCPFASDRVDAKGLGVVPYGGGYIYVTVRDGEVVRASIVQLYEAGFSFRVWGPFAGWIAAAHPDDVQVMYTDETRRRARLTDESIGLWERHTREYVEAGYDYVAEVQAICESASQRVAAEPFFRTREGDSGARTQTEYYLPSWGRVLDDALVELRAIPQPANLFTDRYDRAFDLAEQFADDMQSGNIDVAVIHELERIPGMTACTFDGPR